LTTRTPTEKKIRPGWAEEREGPSITQISSSLTSAGRIAGWSAKAAEKSGPKYKLGKSS
jgi:hypothetical protein